MQKLANCSNHFLYSQNKISPYNVILLKGVLIPNWLNNPLATCSLISLNFLDKC